MRWGGIDWCDIWTYLPLDIQPDGLMKSLLNIWTEELGEIIEVRLCDHGLGVDLQGVMVSVPEALVSASQLQDYLDTPSIDIVRAEHVTEKKSGEGVKSEHLNIKDFLLDMYFRAGYLIMEIAVNGSATEFLQTLLKIDRKTAERFNVTLEDVIVKESWEK
jgi:hypothetical protein